jgi:uncharacterized cupredoxin-like copper-binding protein
MMAVKISRRTLATVCAAAIVITACTTGQASPVPASAGPTAAAGTVQVTLQEWAVLPVPASTPAGDVTFQVTNTGPADVHELVIVKTDLDPTALPTDDAGKVAEGGSGMEVIDEIEDIAVGQTEELKVTLDAGKYVLLCNIYDETEKEAHYQMGMRIAFEVTGG